MRPNLQIQKLIYFILLQFKKLDLRKKEKKSWLLHWNLPSVILSHKNTDKGIYRNYSCEHEALLCLSQ